MLFRSSRREYLLLRISLFIPLTTKLDSVEWEVDYVITHTCASSLLAKTLYPKHDWEKPDTDRLTNFFNELEYKLDFKRWYYGHFHIDRNIDHRHTTLLDAIVPLGEGIPVGYSLGL